MTQIDQNQIVIKPSFLLRGVDPENVIKQYFSGYFSRVANLTIPTAPENVDITPVSSDIKVSISPDDEVYEFLDRSNNKQRVLMINYKLYSEAIGKKSQPKKVCQKHRGEFDSLSLGIPIKLERRIIQTSNSAGTTPTSTPTSTYIFHTIGSYCCFECAYQEVIDEMSKSGCLKNPIYSDSETLISMLFSIMYPNKKLTGIPDWRLHQVNGGPLSDKEFFNQKSVYTMNPTVILTPIRNEYLKSDRLVFPSSPYQQPTKTAPTDEIQSFRQNLSLHDNNAGTNTLGVINAAVDNVNGDSIEYDNYNNEFDDI